MWKRLLHFVQYNNAFVLIVGLMFSGAAATFAASPEARSAVYAENQQVLSVDNTYLLSTDIETYAFDAKIVGITEDDETYYVDYSYKTIEVVDYVWRDVVKTGQMMPSKKQLVGKDLGLYVADQLSQVVRTAKVTLAETQKNERVAGLSQKIVSTEYSGLIGRMLNPTEETFPGYTPVVDEEKFKADREEQPGLVDAGSIVAQVSRALRGEDPAGSFQKGIASADNPIPGYPTITLLGNNPATIEKGASYVDLGGTVDDDKDKNLGLSVAGEQIDTSKPGEHEVHYSVTDNDGNTTIATRHVKVVDPYAVVQADAAPETDPGAGSSSESTSPAASSTPETSEPGAQGEQGSTSTSSASSTPSAESSTDTTAATTTESSTSVTAPSTPAETAASTEPQQPAAEDSSSTTSASSTANTTGSPAQQSVPVSEPSAPIEETVTSPVTTSASTTPAQ